jgi:ABC-type sugar transport system substrate-binding protein
MKKLLALLLTVVLVFAMAACAAPATADNSAAVQTSGAAAASASVSSAQGKADGDIYIVDSQYAMLSPFFVAASYGFCKEAQMLGIKAKVMDGGNVLQKQIDQINDAITQGADAIIITPMDSDALSVAVEACNKANIPVFTIDRTITGGQVTTVCQSDNVECGRKVARGFLEQAKAKSITELKLIQIKGQLGSSPSRDRDKGFWEIMNAQTDVKVTKLVETAADWDSTKSEPATLAGLTAHPECNAIFYEADCMLPGVAAAMKQLNKWLPQSDAAHIINGGVDGSKFALDSCRGGEMDVCVSQMPYSQGTVATIMAYNAVKYGTGKAGSGEYSPQLLFDTQVVTPSNIASFGDGLWGDLPIGGSELPADLRAMLLS